MCARNLPHGAVGRRSLFCSAVLAVAITVVAASPALSQDRGAAERGAAIVDQWCSLCHLQAGDRPDQDMAPPFDELVERPGRDRAFYLSFMDEDHFPMTTFRLFDDEKRDVVEYLLSLQR